MILRQSGLIAVFSAFLFFSCTGKKTKTITSAEKYPANLLSDSIHHAYQPYMDTAFSDSDSGMLAIAVYLKKGEELLVDTAFFLSNKQQPLPNDSTFFEMGSVTKTFTAALLARQVNNGSIRLNDLAQQYLTDSGSKNYFKLPEYNHTPITVRNLATMNSGLSLNVPVGKKAKETTYKEGFAYLDTAHLHFQPGSKSYLYSNLGYAVLGFALCAQVFPDSNNYYLKYEKVVADSLLAPLGLNDTRVFTLTTNTSTRWAIPYETNKQRTDYYSNNWPMNIAAGGLYSTMRDMRRYAYEMTGQGNYLTKGDLDTLLTPVTLYQKWNGNQYSDLIQQALAWVLTKDLKDSRGATHNRYYKDGAKGGFCTFVTFSTPTIGSDEYKSYVVVWANRAEFPVGKVAHAVLQLLYNLSWI